MLTCEGYKMFSGTATITPCNPEMLPFTLTGTWLYRPDTDCWYCNGRSFAARVVDGIVEITGAKEE